MLKQKILKNLNIYLIALVYVSYTLTLITGHAIFISENPKFSEPITNVTAAVGREAILACKVEDLGQYKVSLSSTRQSKGC